MKGVEPTYGSGSKRAALLLVLALSAHFAAPWLWNDYLYPASTALLPGSRIMYSLVPLLICAALLLWRSRGFGLLRSRSLFVLAMVCAPAGTALVVAVLSLSLHPALLLVGIALFGAGRLFVFLVLSGELIRCDLRFSIPVVVMSLLLSGVWDALAGLAPTGVAYALAAGFEGLSAVACLAVSLSTGADALGSARARREERASGCEVTPRVARRALVPSNFLLAIGAFFLIFGFSGRYFEGGQGSLAFFCSFVPLLILGLLIVLRPKSFTLDPIYRTALILTALGFVCIAFPGIVPPSVANMIVMGGSHCFVVIYWIGLCSACRRRPNDAATILLWGRSFASGGTLAGTLFALGMLLLKSFDAQIEGFVAAIFALLYMALALLVLRNVDCVVALPESGGRAGTVERLSEKYGLTLREREIVSLLAKGRNAQYIQDELFISKNTVKSHMKHIYAKLGVHTQQELLSLFEDGDSEDPAS